MATSSQYQYQYHDGGGAPQYETDTKEDIISAENYEDALPEYGYSNFDVVEKADYQQRLQSTQPTQQSNNEYDCAIQELPRSASVSYHPQPRLQAGLPAGAMRALPR